MNFSKKALAVGSMAAILTVGTAGVVAAAGVQGKGPASVLSSLVSDGTLTQEQADKVADAMKNQREQMHKEREAQRAEMQALVAKTLGISEADLEAARKEGKSLKDIAGDKRDDLVAAMVAFETAKIDKAVADGSLTQEQADKMKANMQERIENRVDGKGPDGNGPHGRGGPGGPGRDGDAEPGAFEGGPPSADDGTTADSSAGA